MVSLEGFGPSTTCLEGRCSIQLSYRETQFTLKFYDKMHGKTSRRWIIRSKLSHGSGLKEPGFRCFESNSSRYWIVFPKWAVFWIRNVNVVRKIAESLWRRGRFSNRPAKSFWIWDVTDFSYPGEGKSLSDLPFFKGRIYLNAIHTDSRNVWIWWSQIASGIMVARDDEWDLPFFKGRIYLNAIHTDSRNVWIWWS